MNVLEAILRAPDPRLGISAYHDMPYAICRYDPLDEFALRAGSHAAPHASRADRQARDRDLARGVHELRA